MAAITYNGIQNVDLSLYTNENHPPGWNQIEGPSAKSSLSKFAWEIRGGDTIFIADSDSQQIVGMGHPRAEVGDLAYRFDPNSPIESNLPETWCHLIDMDWEDNFAHFRPETLRAPLYTVLGLNQDEVESFSQATGRANFIQGGAQEENIERELLLDDSYTRYSPAALRLIRRKHASLSNDFRSWLNDEYQIQVAQEQQQIDANFEVNNLKYLVEFKVAYQGNTKRAVREALGQILEYNYYPLRTTHDHWLLVLDTIPREEDKAFLSSLRDAFRVPLFLGWVDNSSFQFEPQLNLES